MLEKPFNDLAGPERRAMVDRTRSWQDQQWRRTCLVLAILYLATAAFIVWTVTR